MRTTLTVDDTLMNDLREAAFKRGVPLKTIVNQALRAGLRQLREPDVELDYACPTFSMGHPPGLNLVKALGLAAELENDEVVRKMQLRK